MLLTWTLRIGPVVHRESIPLSELPNLRRRVSGDTHVIRVSGDTALFAVATGFASSDDAGLVTKGSVVIEGGNAEIAYRASVGSTVFLALWFGLLIAGEIAVWFFPPDKPLTLALTLFAMMAGAALLVRRAIRVEVGLLRGIALEAAMRLRG